MAIAPCLKHGKSTTLKRLEVQQPSVRLSASRSWGGLRTGEGGHVNQPEEENGSQNDMQQLPRYSGLPYFVCAKCI